jgi:hypothetical protein
MASILEELERRFFALAAEDRSAQPISLVPNVVLPAPPHLAATTAASQSAKETIGSR